MQRHFRCLSGQTTGFTDSSLTALGDISPGLAMGQAGVQVSANTLVGSLVTQDHLSQIKTRGFDLQVGFIHNSHALDPQKAWRINQAKAITLITNHINQAGSSVSVENEDGSLTVFKYDPKRNCYVYHSITGEQTLHYQSDGSWHLKSVATGGHVEELTKTYISGF